jgi:hypothetical protein
MEIVLTFGLVSGQVVQSEAAQQAALLNYQQNVQNAFGDVANALIASQKLADQLQAQQRLVVALQTYERLANLQYNGGYTSYTTVLQAEQSLFPAQLTLASVRAQMVASSEYLQGDGRRMGLDRRRCDRRQCRVETIAGCAARAAAAVLIGEVLIAVQRDSLAAASSRDRSASIAPHAVLNLAASA